MAQKSWTCSYCNEVFTIFNNYQIHEKQHRDESKAKELEVLRQNRLQQKQLKSESKAKELELLRQEGIRRQIRYNIIQKIMFAEGYSTTSIAIYGSGRTLKLDLIKSIIELIEEDSDLKYKIEQLESTELDDDIIVKDIIDDIYQLQHSILYENSEDEANSAFNTTDLRSESVHWTAITINEHLEPQTDLKSVVQRLVKHREFKKQFLIDKPKIELYNRQVRDRDERRTREYESLMEDYRNGKLDEVPSYPELIPIPYPVDCSYNCTIEQLDAVEQEILSEIRDIKTYIKDNSIDRTIYNYIPKDKSKQISIDEMKYIIIHLKISNTIDEKIEDYKEYETYSKDMIDYVVKVYKSVCKRKVEYPQFETYSKIKSDQTSSYKLSRSAVYNILFFQPRK
jgi:hypothetical protein